MKMKDLMIEKTNEACQECEGSGHMDESACCGAMMDSDILICSDCKDHSEFTECSECDGTGKSNL